jgi:tight adherence protein B
VSPLVTALAVAVAGACGGASTWSHVPRSRARARLHPPASPRHDAIGGSARSIASPWPPAQLDHDAAGSRPVQRWSPAQLAIAGVAAATGIVGVVITVGPVVLVVGSLAAIAAPVARRARRRTERRRLRRTQLPAGLERLATALRAGSSVPTAMLEAGAAMPSPIGAELVNLGREAEAGRAIVDVLDGWSARHDDAGTRLAATALALATAVGGAPGHAVDGVAATLRERVDLADERRALASQARLSALVLALAPLGFAVLLGAADGTTASFLLGTPPGWVCLGAGLGLEAAGAWWMARLTQGAEP